MNLYSKTRFKEKTNSIKCTLKKIILIYTENQSQHIPYNNTCNYLIQMNVCDGALGLSWDQKKTLLL